MDNSYIKDKIKKYAKRQIISLETVETVIMTAIMLFCITETISYGSISTIGAIFTLVISAAALFGLHELIPSILMIFNPFLANIFPDGTSGEEKRRICAEIDKEYASGEAKELDDMLACRNYALLMGNRYLSIIKWIDIFKVTKQEYPNRHGRKQNRYFLNFFSRNGRKRVLDICGTKDNFPLRRLAQVVDFVDKEHPGIELELTERDLEQIRNEIYNN